ncbi:MAG: enoyl-CoA hydratase/isomerase family protein [Acidimicrobiaceae bacterium]|nr:enoyl-CoA hydratase/isomerase family protein [Acidimicrobiaceae bacterium]
MSPVVQLERDPQKGIAVIRLDRGKVNAINEPMLEELTSICNSLAEDREIRAAVLTGGPRHFAAGADIERFPTFDRDDALAFSRRFNDTALGIEGLPQITISAINGYALGGGLELALATDFRVAAGDAQLGNPEVLLGIIPGGGATQRLARLAGVTMAKDLVYSGRAIGAEEALANNLISAIFEPDEVQAEAVKMAEGYAAGPASLQLAKAAVLSGYHLPLDEAVKIESELFADAFTTEDCTIGVQSFLQNGPGKASFTGR